MKNNCKCGASENQIDEVGGIRKCYCMLEDKKPEEPEEQLAPFIKNSDRDDMFDSGDEDPRGCWGEILMFLILLSVVLYCMRL